MIVSFIFFAYNVKKKKTVVEEVDNALLSFTSSSAHLLFSGCLHHAVNQYRGMRD